MYQKLGITKDVEFCKKYDLKTNTVSSWKKRDSIPYELITKISQIENISLDYIINGIEKENNINYKIELLKTIENLKNEDIQYLYHVAKSKELEKK